MNTDQRASRGMLRFVGAIFGIAMIIGAVYFFVLTEGEPDKSTLSNPQTGTSEQHSR
ncbi:hypothetical protein SAMN03159496_06005 [Rhizobium sp. NFR07]|uniref:hypothetical protein n=1 Tax=Rhizobium sp. NFR07 TaxID=1566262 RepID=UPI0008EDB8C1|nr:hypothetical protein [Rhizobium sp. NFR07]SFB62372.1 hypothetical protein SAMN03159496_06005 [Rhizobium sp. NFR07]